MPDDNNKNMLRTDKPMTVNKDRCYSEEIRARFGHTGYCTCKVLKKLFHIQYIMVLRATSLISKHRFLYSNFNLSDSPYSCHLKIPQTVTLRFYLVLELLLAEIFLSLEPVLSEQMTIVGEKMSKVGPTQMTQVQRVSFGHCDLGENMYTE